MLAIIHNDHVNMNLLLKLLKKKIELLKEDQKIDFRLTKAAISYLKNYSDKYHHPMEDFIYDYYLANYVAPNDVVDRLPKEHAVIKKATIDLDELLNMILLDAIVPKEECIERLESFVNLQMAHMMYEEKEIIPLIKKTLTEEDWAKINKEWPLHEYSDPLFGKDISKQYAKLAEVIKQF